MAGNRHHPKGEGKVEQEPFEIWEHRMNELVDKKLTPITEELQNFKTVLNTVVSEFPKRVLELQQLVAALRIDVLVDTFFSVIDDMGDNSLRTQLAANAATTKSQIIHSTNPLDISIQFRDKWAKILQDKGGDIIRF